MSIVHNEKCYINNLHIAKQSIMEWKIMIHMHLLINCIVMLLACIRCCVCTLYSYDVILINTMYFYLKLIWIHHVDMELDASNIDHMMFFCMNIFASNIPKVELYNLRWLKLKFHKFSNVIVKIIESFNSEIAFWCINHCSKYPKDLVLTHKKIFLWSRMHYLSPLILLQRLAKVLGFQSFSPFVMVAISWSNWCGKHLVPYNLVILVWFFISYQDF
jgi:hypothetical protein